MRTVPTGFVPDEDMGSLMVDISTPPGYTMAATNEVLVRASDRIQQLPEVESVGGVTGLGGSNKAMIQIQLHPWGERSGKEHSSRSVSEKINAILTEETGARSFVTSPGMIDGYGRGGGFEFSILNHNGADINTFFDISQRFIESLNNCPEISDAYSGYEVNYPQYRVDVDFSRCKKFGVSPSSLLNEMAAFLGSSYVSNFNAFRYMMDGKAEGYDFARKPNPVPANKQLLIIPGASHCDLYDGGGKGMISWNNIEEFLKRSFK